MGEERLGRLAVRLVLLDELLQLLLERRLRLLERGELRLELLLLARVRRVLDLLFDLLLLGLVLRQLLQGGGQLLGRLRAVADELLRLRAPAGDLLVQCHLLGLELVRRGLNLRLLLLVRLRLSLERSLLRLQAALLLLELFLLRRELVALRGERVCL